MGFNRARQALEKCVQHAWRIWPETNGLEQRCVLCGENRPTPVDDLPANSAASARVTTLTLQVPTELLGAIDHRAQQESLLRDAWMRIALANASASPGPAHQRDWACPECGCAHGVAGEPYWTHGKPHEVEAIWACDRCGHEHAIPYVSANTSAASTGK